MKQKRSGIRWRTATATLNQALQPSSHRLVPYPFRFAVITYRPRRPSIIKNVAIKSSNDSLPEHCHFRNSSIKTGGREGKVLLAAGVWASGSVHHYTLHVSDSSCMAMSVAGGASCMRTKHTAIRQGAPKNRFNHQPNIQAVILFADRF